MFASTLSGSNCPSKVQHMAFGIRWAMNRHCSMHHQVDAEHPKSSEALLKSEPQKVPVHANIQDGQPRKTWMKRFTFRDSARSEPILLLNFSQVSLDDFTFPDSFPSFKNISSLANAIFKSIVEKLHISKIPEKTFHFSEICHLGFWRKQRFQEKKQREKVSNSFKEVKAKPLLHAELQSGTF